MEDIDEMIGGYGEHEILSFLDGEKQIDKRRTNRHHKPPRTPRREDIEPSIAFRRTIFVGMPSAESRLTYLQNAIQRSGALLDNSELIRWRDDTEGLSIAHLRELIAGALCLNEPL